MKRNEFENLKIGDIVVIKRGHDQGKKCKVIYIEREIDGCDSILLKAIDCEFKCSSWHSNRYLRLTGSHELDIYQK